MFFWYFLTFFSILIFTISSILLLFLDLAGRPSPLLFFVLGLLCRWDVFLWVFFGSML